MDNPTVSNTTLIFFLKNAHKQYGISYERIFVDVSISVLLESFYASFLLSSCLPSSLTTYLFIHAFSLTNYPF
jgi:hypothetical protein